MNTYPRKHHRPGCQLFVPFQQLPGVRDEIMENADACEAPPEGPVTPGDDAQELAADRYRHAARFVQEAGGVISREGAQLDDISEYLHGEAGLS